MDIHKPPITHTINAPLPSRPNRRKPVIILLLTTTIIVGLALGLGLGLTIGRRKKDTNTSNPDSSLPPNPHITSTPLPPSPPPPWIPPLSTQWQILLLNPPHISSSAENPIPNPSVPIYDLDLFTTPTSTITALHEAGKKVICYFSGGSYEPNRPDSGDFEEGDIGSELEGWPGERWVDLRSSSVRSVIKGRVELAAEKGCDGIDVDNVDGYQNTNGLSLTPDDSISFIAYLSTLTVPLNLTLGLKNAGDIIPYVLPVVHFSVNEQCIEYNECDVFHQFIDAGKPVFHIEYPKDAGERLGEQVVERYCKENGQFSTVLKRMDLDGWVQYCDGNVQVTAMDEGSGGG